MTPNFQQLRRDLGKTAAIIVNQAERGTLHDYLERAKVPTYDKRLYRTFNWYGSMVRATEQELEDNTRLVKMYEIYVNGEFYGVTRNLDVNYINDIYPHFRQMLRREKVDAYDIWTKELVKSNHSLYKTFNWYC